MPNVFTLSVFMLSVIMLNVVALLEHFTRGRTQFHWQLDQLSMVQTGERYNKLECFIYLFVGLV